VGDIVTVTIRYDQAELIKQDAEAQDASVFRLAAMITRSSFKTASGTGR
jgi:hypothetical protein